MTEIVAEFWRAAESLADGVATIRRGRAGCAELFIPTPSGTLEISGSGEFVSVAWNYLIIEDRPVRSTDDADFLLAVCDAVLAGRANASRAKVRVELLTRGYSHVWSA